MSDVEKSTGELSRLLKAAEVLFAPLCRDATAMNWLDDTRAALQSAKPALTEAEQTSIIELEQRLADNNIAAAARDKEQTARIAELEAELEEWRSTNKVDELGRHADRMSAECSSLRHQLSHYTRLALRTSHLLGLFRDHALSFDHHDDAMLGLGCRLLDDIESILNDINGHGTPPASYVEGLERFAHSFLTPDAARSTTPDTRDAARRVLGLPDTEQRHAA